MQNAKPTTDNGQLQCKTDNRQRKTGQLVVPVGRLSVVSLKFSVESGCRLSVVGFELKSWRGG
jgi:hypothetical protein